MRTASPTLLSRCVRPGAVVQTSGLPARQSLALRWCLVAHCCLIAATFSLGCTHVIPNSTPYYKDGPDQVEGPQGDIPAGAKAWVIWRKDSYARVWTDGGVDGWVWDRAVVSIWEQEKQIREEKKRAEEREKLRKAQQAERERQLQQQPPPPAESQPAEQP